MIVLVTWNVQYGLGCDGQNDIHRIAQVASDFCDADIYCFQEVSVRDPTLDQGRGDDQAIILAKAFPRHRSYFAPAVDFPIPDSPFNRQFGNLILCRLPVLQVLPHLLPRPADSGIKHMQRGALELVVQKNRERFRVVCTHLEANSKIQSLAQVTRLRELHAEAADESRAPPMVGVKSPYDLAPRPSGMIMCGDFNFPVGASQYQVITSPVAPWASSLKDAWTTFHGDIPHAPTCGIYDLVQWPEGPHARDFFFVSENLLSYISGITVNHTTDVSDHQPIRLEIDL